MYAEPPDFVPEPDGFLPKVKNPQVRAWALEVHALWKNLSRRVSGSVLNRPKFHTLLPLPRPFVIPGSRFTEVYYWDSYWVIMGLLASKMYMTAKAIVTNLISLIDTYGYVLNYARAYCTNRRKTSDFTTLAITSILPVDLNIFILKMELDIASMAQIVGDNRTAESFLKAAQARKQAINSVFWNKEKGQWLDYWINTCIVEKVKKSFQSSGFLGAAGIATSLTRSREQWDFPNGWAPLQHMIVEGLAKSGLQEAKSMAQDIAMRWINTNYVAYKETGAMHEKYDVEKCGDIGGGGEYIPQTGFGWSNGVVLAFLEEFGWPEDLKIGCN
ncbi:Trehalase [Citrus sinensis]|uniref:Trehalase n=1 Tax=Citrus sinensis TaxID=2711 RepID=A0ACB8LNN9_CITSI|nr:Trehalase [Citrus sinensis]